MSYTPKNTVFILNNRRTYWAPIAALYAWTILCRTSNCYFFHFKYGLGSAHSKNVSLRSGAVLANILAKIHIEHMLILFPQI